MDVPFAAVSVPAGNGDGTANLMSSSSTELQRLDALAVNEALTPKDEVNDVLREASGLGYLDISGQKWNWTALDIWLRWQSVLLGSARYLISLFEFAQFVLVFHDVWQILSNPMWQTAQLPVAPQRFGVLRQCWRSCECAWPKAKRSDSSWRSSAQAKSSVCRSASCWSVEIVESVSDGIGWYRVSFFSCIFCHILSTG